MRIIAGDSRGVRLETLKGEDTRPTLERVKEGMFSSIQFILPGAKVLDLFAGSGQLGLEALSRGAASCTFVDSDKEAITLIGRNAEAAGLKDRSRIIRGEAASFLSREGGGYDIVLIDPPYRQETLPKLLPKISAHCAQGATVLCEAEKGAQLPEEAQGLRLVKEYKYGTVKVCRYIME